MMPGMIMLWYGSIATIPSGWVLCNGDNNTPNLSGKFVRGAGLGAPNSPGATGGSSTHDHVFTGDGHSHEVDDGSSISPDGVPNTYDHHTKLSPATGTTESGSSYPPYHVLCYIMKTPIP